MVASAGQCRAVLALLVGKAGLWNACIVPGRAALVRLTRSARTAEPRPQSGRQRAAGVRPRGGVASLGRRPAACVSSPGGVASSGLHGTPSEPRALLSPFLWVLFLKTHFGP